MAKYDWEKLRRKFVTTSRKCTLKQFATDNNIPYGLLRDNASGWIEEKKTKQRQKSDKIIDKTINRQIESEVEMNIRHYDIGLKLLSLIERSSGIKEIIVSPKGISALASALEKTQKVQRIASGLDKNEGGSKSDIIKDFMEGVINGDGTTNQ